MGEVKVTQDDRDAAANAWARRFGKSHFEDEIMDLFEGRNDQHPLVQDFARHRQAAEKAQQERGFNVNESVWVKLTDEGRAYHRRRYSERYPMLPYRVPDESNDGWSKWQLWSLMQEFGDAIHMGGHVPFETTIRLTDPTTAIRRQNHE